MLHSDHLALHAATDRQLTSQDPGGRMLLLSCGAALHHAQVALTAEGWSFTVERPAGDPLATIRPGQRGSIDPRAIRHFEQLRIRHTDRRTLSNDPVGDDVLDRLAEETERHGARLHLLDGDQVIELAVLVEHAQAAQAADEAGKEETAAWVGGDRPEGTGIPDANLPVEVPATTVAERDFGVGGTLEAGSGHDTAATYGVLYGNGDEPADWLRAGEALSALWLAATEHGAALLPLSSPVEVP
ncbi:nitroreductase, partial [Actinoplanes sp. NPDC051633]